jgi:heme oxygenase
MSSRVASRASSLVSFAARRHASTTAAAPDLPGEIFKRSKHNKLGLAKVLDDVTMRSGEHDMRVFGTGTLAALKSKSAYISFAASHHHFYDELENRLDDAHRENTPSGRVWGQFSSELRRAHRLERDLETLLGTSVGAHPPSPATSAYVAAIADAAEREKGAGNPPFLVGHFYCRYLADLFGGSMMGWPTRRALGLAETPGFYTHDDAHINDDRFAYVERVYAAINASAEGLSEDDVASVADEAKTAFRLNAGVYREDGRGSSVAAAYGGVKVMWGYAKERVWGAKEQRDIFGRLVKRRDPETGEFKV